MGKRKTAPCSIPGCPRLLRARSWCATHYSHWQKWGDPLGGNWRPGAFANTNPVDRFWSQVDCSGDCWLWTGFLNQHGYGVLRIGGTNYLAHRYAYQLFYGSKPVSRLDHACHDRRCIRQDSNHVRPATQKQNMENRRGPQSNGTSGYRGVSWDKTQRKWAAHLTHYGHKKHLGYFNDINDANAAAIAGRNQIFTHNSRDRTYA